MCALPLPQGCFSVLFYLLHDRLCLNGMILEYLETHFMFTYQEYLPDVDNIVYVHQPDWHLIKRTLIILFTAAVLLWLVALQISTAIYGRWIRRKISVSFKKWSVNPFPEKMILSCLFLTDMGILPPKLSQIRERMEHHEQVLKEEAARKNDLITYLAPRFKNALNLCDRIPVSPQRGSGHACAPAHKICGYYTGKSPALETLINEFFDITRLISSRSQ